MGEIHRIKSKTKHVATQGKNLSCVLETQELQMSQRSKWVPGHTKVITGCLQTIYCLWPWRRLFQNGSGKQFSTELSK